MTKRSALGLVSNDDLSKPLKIMKPSLDSDEEDYNDKDCFRLHEADIDGQESATIEYDDLMKITPFNMKEEIEEDGHFDADGTFIFKKTKDARDNWLEEVNWLEVRRRQQTNPLKNTAVSDEPSDTPVDRKQRLELYKQILHLLKPSENVLRGIKRMGACTDTKKSASASQRWLQKKKPSDGKKSGDPDGLVRLTELADQLIQSGEFDAYQKTYEDIARIIDDVDQAEADDELEALGKLIDSEQEANRESNSASELQRSQVVLWYLRRSLDKHAQSEGPYTSQQLKQWLEEGKFEDPSHVFIRESTKPDGQFYKISRIDFDLYE